ncbi:MAG: rhomboid family intramembrane serine protease [Acidobacteria bacterium]|nr:rhomboid family intramembrane serine protease [Acidobacteriota bacterium]
MLRRTSGSVVCPSCGSLVGVNDERCYTCGRANPGMWGFAPLLRQFGNDLGFVPLVTGACGVMFVLSLLVSMRLGGSPLNAIMSMNGYTLEALGASGALPVFGYGRWWTVLSATWLHAGFLHILFNMMALRNIGYGTVSIVGPGRTIIIYVISGACGFLLSSAAYVYLPALPLLHGARLTVGASASIFGLVGALVHYGRRSGSRMLYTQMMQWALIMFLYSLFMPGIDNWAHAGGFAGGYLTSSFLNPLTREKGDHLLIAAVLLLLSALSIVVSIYQSWGRIVG